MADIAARDRLPAGSTPRPRSSGQTQAQATERGEKPPRSDVGTIILHWSTAIAFVVSLLTGIRMATFGWVAAESIAMAWRHHATGRNVDVALYYGTGAVLLLDRVSALHHAQRLEAPQRGKEN